MDTITIGLLVGVAYVGYKIYDQIRGTYQHIDHETMELFWLNRLKRDDPKEHERVVAHLGICEKCRDLLDQVSREGRPDQPLIKRRFNS